MSETIKREQDAEDERKIAEAIDVHKKWPRKKKSIDIGKITLVQDGPNSLWLWGIEGESMNLTSKTIQKLEAILNDFMMREF